MGVLEQLFEEGGFFRHLSETTEMTNHMGAPPPLPRSQESGNFFFPAPPFFLAVLREGL